MRSDIFVAYLPGQHTPYTRMTQKGKWKSAAARKYLESQDRLRGCLMEAKMTQGYTTEPIFERRTPLRMVLLYDWCLNNQDLSNLLKAVEDAANGIVWDDDRWVDEILTTRHKRGRKGMAVLIVMPVSIEWEAWDDLVNDSAVISALRIFHELRDHRWKSRHQGPDD